jgi:prophage antirepressor-like protein
MNKVTIFKYEENKLVRTMNVSGEPWFVLKDVCDVLGLSTPARVAERLDSDEVSQAHLIDSMGRSQEMTIISESGLYNVILRSDKPEAKPFRKWVTAVVLPSIRKNGGYIAGQEELSPQELMAKALLVAQKTLTDRDARIKELTAQNQIMQPKAEYFDELVARNLLTNFRETAKELGIKEKDFIGWLLDHKYVYRDQKNKLMPYAAKNNGLFEVKEGKGRHNDWTGTQTLITPKGRETFRLLCKEPPVLPQFATL